MFQIWNNVFRNPFFEVSLFDPMDSYGQFDSYLERLFEVCHSRFPLSCFDRAVEKAVNFLGDADTVGAIAGEAVHAIKWGEIQHSPGIQTGFDKDFVRICIICGFPLLQSTNLSWHQNTFPLWIARSNCRGFLWHFQHR